MKTAAEIIAEGSLPETATIGDRYKPAMAITDPEEANAYLCLLVSRLMIKATISAERAAEIERANLGYFAGYYDRITRERVESLFKCEHPIFGPTKPGSADSTSARK